MHAEAQALDSLGALARERGELGLAAEAEAARAALAAGRFNVAIVGQFKRGKSTLINALLGREALPADVAPVTSAITLVEHAPSDRLTVRFADGHSEDTGLEAIGRFATEEANPGNRLGVQVVTVGLPAPFLQLGVRLVDTPGVGSVFAANSEITRRFLPRIDVAVMVLGADPPITGEELALLREVAPHAGRLIFVLNKIDRVREATRQKAESFARTVIAQALGSDPGPMIHASARAALAQGGDEGVAALRERLRELAADGGESLSRASAARAARDIATHLGRRLDLEEAALRTPLDELARRSAAFAAAVRDVGDLALAAITRVRAEPVVSWPEWQERRRRFVDERIAAIVGRVAEELLADAGASRRVLRRRAAELARELTAKGVSDWHAVATAELERVRERRLSRVGEETNRLVDRVGAAAASAFGVPVARFEPRALAAGLGPVVLELVAPALALDVNEWLLPAVDAFLPRRLVARRAAARSRALAEEWFRVNLGAIDEHFVEALDALTSQLEAAMHERLAGVEREIEAAIEEGRRRRRTGEAAVAERLEELRRDRERIAAALAQLPALGNAREVEACRG